MSQDPLPETGVLLLAAGRGQRMLSNTPKVLHLLAGEPMIAHVLRQVHAGIPDLLSNNTVIVVGHAQDEVRAVISDASRIVVQEDQFGTGHAVRCGLADLPPGADPVVVVHGDEPLIGAARYQQMLEVYRRSKPAIVLLTGTVSKTRNLGRVIRDQDNRVVSLTQEGELKPHERLVHEINFGAYVFDRNFLATHIGMLKRHPSDEFYLTDLIEVAAGQMLGIETVAMPDADERLGVNDLEDLMRAERVLGNPVSAGTK